MADVTRTARRTGGAAQQKTTDVVEQAADAGEQVQGGGAGQAGEQDRDAAGGGGGQRDDGKATLRSELQETIREAAIEVLKPVARMATKSAATYAVQRGPDLVKNRVASKVTEAGGAGAIAKTVAGKRGGLTSKLGTAASGVTDKLSEIGTKRSDSGSRRRLPVMEFVDAGVDVRTAYDQFTQFEDWPEFMRHVEKVEQRDDKTLMFHGNIWGLRRSWEAEIVEQVPDERIVWRGTDDAGMVGVATFHRLSDNLTRIQVDLDSQPQGLVEKFAPGARVSGRALRSDLLRLKAFLEMRDEATGAWRGRIEEGEVVDEGDDEDEAREDERDELSGAEAEAESEDAAEDEDEPQAAEGEDYEDEDEADDEEEEESEEPQAEAEEDSADEDEEEPEEEPEPAPAPRRRRRTTSAGRSATSRS